MGAEIETQSTPVQFSVRTLLLITTNVAVLAAIGQLHKHAFGDTGTLIKAYAALLTIYAWRFAGTRSENTSRTKWFVLLATFACCLPYIYACVGSMFNEPFGLPPSKWIGTPVWIFAIPFLSFWFFDLNDKWCSPTAFLIRSLIEIVVLFLVWSYIWGFIQLFILEWAWI
jgi:hypothetical protein